MRFASASFTTIVGIKREVRLADKGRDKADTHTYIHHEGRSSRLAFLVRCAGCVVQRLHPCCIHPPSIKVLDRVVNLGLSEREGGVAGSPGGKFGM